MKKINALITKMKMESQLVVQNLAKMLKMSI